MNDLNVLLKRIARKANYTIGRLYVDGVYVCDTLEDRDRLYFGENKVYGKTAIPVGTYTITFTYSPKFSKKDPYKYVGDGYLPLLLDVPQFDAIRIHCGNDENDSAGCVLVGKNKVVGKVLDSRATYRTLMNKYLLPARQRRQKITIKIQ